MATCPSDNDLEAFAHGALARDARSSLHDHIAGCTVCTRRYLPYALRQSMAAAPESMEDTHVSDHSMRISTAHAALNKGTALERYTILERLGSGGMGDVFAAWDPVLDRKVALKLLRADREGTAFSTELRARLVREAQAMAQLAHPNVLAVHDVGQTDDRVFLAMEYVDGITLTQWLAKQPRTWKQTLEVFVAAGEGLAAAHAAGLVHRDFKPDNVIISNDGRVRVLDFGLARANTETPLPTKPTHLTDSDSSVRRILTPAGTMLGTPAYMSPEALQALTTDHRSDEFSFCVALFEALYGYRPFQGDSAATVFIEAQANRTRPPPPGTAVPARIHELIVRGLRADPAERFQTMRALLVQLARRRSQARRQRIVLGFVALSAVLLLVIGAFVQRERQRCGGLSARLGAVWNPSLRDEMKAAFVATKKPWAEAAWRDVDARLDSYASQWLMLRKAACEVETSATDDALGQRIVCLSHRFNDFSALTTLFTHADTDVVERAVSSAASLASLESCAAAVVVVPREEHDDLRASLSSAKALVEVGKYADASKALAELSARAKAVNDREVAAEAALHSATVAWRTGGGATADALFEDAILAAEAARDDDLAARAWVERVGLASLNAKAAASSLIRFAEAAVQRAPPSQELEAGLSNNIGLVERAQGHFDLAISAANRALVLRTKMLGPKHPLVARTHANLGSIYKSAGQLNAAADEYRQALALEEAAYDRTHPAVGETLNNLGNVLAQQHKQAEAREALERALAIREGAHGATSPQVAMTLSNLGALLVDMHDEAAAIRALDRALTLKEATAGPNAITVAVTLTNLAQAHRQQGGFRKAIELDQRALEIRAKAGPVGADSAPNLEGQGEAWIALHEPTRARTVLLQAYALRGGGVPRAETAARLVQALTSPKDKAERAKFRSEAEVLLPVDSPLRALLK